MLKLFFVLILSSFTYVSLGADNTDVSLEEPSNLIADLLEGVEEDPLDNLLFLTVQSGNIEIISDALEQFPQQLVEYKDPNTGRTPFLEACYYENMEIMELLLNKNPEIINDVDNDGNSCVNLLIAEGIYEGLNQKIKTLIAQGVDVTKANNAGDNSWLLACAKGNMEIMEYLLDEKGVDVNSENTMDGWACLHYLTMGRYLDHFRKLVNRGADITKATNTGETSWLTACAMGDMGIMEYLLDEKGVDVNSANETDGFTCLHYLAIKQHEDYIRILMSRGADHKKADASGRLPAHILIQVQNQSQ